MLSPMSESSARERVIASASVLFAELGYDCADLTLVATSAGVDLREVRALFGGRHDLYVQVMADASQREISALAPALVDFTLSREGLRRLVDAYLDFNLAHPYVSALWMQRSLADASDITRPDSDYVRPTFSMLGALLKDLVAPGIRVEYAIWTIVWATHGYVTARQAEHKAGRAARCPANFREHLNAVAVRMMDPEVLAAADVRRAALAR